MKILIADDDRSVRLAVAEILQAEGYACCHAEDGVEVLIKLGAEQPDMLILDIMMPGMNGFDVCSAIREKEEYRKMPILMLSAKGDFVDKSVGFRFGANDYLVKPFEPAELCAHVRALLKRSKVEKDTSADIELSKVPKSGGNNGEGTERDTSIIRCGDLEIFLNRYEVRLKGKKVPMTGKEFEILSFLASSPDDVFTREEILSFLWGRDSLQKDLTTVTVFVRKIREKIEEDPSNPKYIQTVWRVGYKFCKGPW